MQADLGSSVRVAAILLQGRGDHNQYVTSFTLAVSDDGRRFRFIKRDGSTSAIDDNAVVFPGSYNKDSVVEVRLPVPIETHYVRLFPQTFVGHISLRWDILRCEGGGKFFNI